MQTYQHVMDAQEQIAGLLRRNGVTDEQLERALELAHPDLPGADSEEDVYLFSLARFVAALGGHLELRAVFPGASVRVDRGDLPTGDGDRLDPDQISGSEAS